MVSSLALLATLALVPQDADKELFGDAATEAEVLTRESAYYKIVTMPLPDDLVLEVSGIAPLPDKRVMVCTRRGEVFIVEGAYGDDPTLEDVRYLPFADGLQEPMGLQVHDGWIYTVQRGELSRMRDTDGDDRMDELETVCDDWRISGNYHEYSFGPRIDPAGNFWITTNKPFGSEPFGRVDWRGFALRVTPDGRMLPTSCGLRSPAGIEVSPWGDAFYTDNQGEWCGASKLAHLEAGDYHGHPWGIDSCDLPEWTYTHPHDPPDGKLMPEVAERIPSFKLPAVWFPYDKMGNSPAGMAWDQTRGAFGPFEGQLFVGDQHHSSILRVFLEKVNGHWQGAAIPFRYGFQSGIIRLVYGSDGALFVGMSNRGWGSMGYNAFGLERLVWTGEMPFEVHEMRARPRGFELTFTQPVDLESAGAPASYRMESYTYRLHSPYGSDEFDRAEPRIARAEVAPDDLSVNLTVDGLRAGYVHELHLEGVRSSEGMPLLHPEAYYTLIEIPDSAPDEVAHANRLSELERAAGWRQLFDGETTAGWRGLGKPGFPEQGWVVENGCLHHTDKGGGGDIVTEEVFGDFELAFEWKIAPGGNSGVKIRIDEAKGALGCEYQILDDTRHKNGRITDTTAGALYDVIAPDDKHLELPGRFNTARIVARGNHIEHWLNGRRILACEIGSEAWRGAIADSKFRSNPDFAKAASGHILLQDHQDAVWYRNIRIRDLSSLPGERVELFNGTNLDGWTALGDASYRVEDGSIVGEVDGGSQSFLKSDAIYGDFTLDVDLKIDVKGNSGIQIRSHVRDTGRLYGYQIEIDPKPRRWSGGLYDEARRGWLHNLEDNPAGRAAFNLEGWNHYRIECLGPWIRTWVNGVPVADYLDPADLSGHFALQIHSGKAGKIRWKNLDLHHYGIREWEPVFADEALENWAAAGLLSNETFGDLALRVVFDDTKDSRWTLGFRTREQVRDRSARPEVAPGLRAGISGWWVDPLHEKVRAAFTKEGPQTLTVIALRERVVLHVNDKLVSSVRLSEGRREGHVALQMTGADGSVRAVEVLGPLR